MEQMFFPVTRREAERSGVEYSSKENKSSRFPSQLRELRAEKGVSQETLSKVLGVSKSTIGLWETGDTLPDAKTIYDLAGYFGVSTEYLLCRTQIKTADSDLKSVCEYTGLSEGAVKFLRYIGHDPDTPKGDILPLILSCMLESYEFFQALSGLAMACRAAGMYPDKPDHAAIQAFESAHTKELAEMGAMIWPASAASDMFISQANSRFLICMEKVRSQCSPHP